jgi:Na+-driven multidrug efflux pump
MDNYLKISGYVKTSMAVNVGSNLSTLGLLTFFLLVLKMDVVGSALATSISFCLCSLIALIPFLRRKTLLQFTRPKFSAALFKEIAACGTPTFLNNVAGRITSVLMNISLMNLGTKAWGEGGGTTAVAVYAVLMYASDLCWPLLYGISGSLSPAIGYNWGAENYGRVKKIVRCAYIGTATVGLISTPLLFFFPGAIASLFVSAEDTLLLETSKHAIRLFCFAYLFRWFGVTTQGFLSAIERPALATMMSVSTAFLFPVLSLGALWSLGLDGIWLNFVGVTAGAAILGAVFVGKIFREIREKEQKIKS